MNATEAQRPWPDDDPSLAALSEPTRHKLAFLVRHLFWLLPLSFYAWTGSRGVGWLDSAMLVNNVYLLKVSSWVNSHNLFLYSARLWLLLSPLDNPAWSLTLYAGLFGALTVHFLFRAGLLWTGNLLASLAGAIALMLSHSLWWHSTSLEVYTLNTFLIGLMLFLVIRYDRERRLSDLYGALFCFGLGISNHVLMGLFLFAFLALLLVPGERQTLWRRPVLLLGIAVVLLGAQLWLTRLFEDFIRELNQRPYLSDQTLQAKLDALRHTLYRALGGRFQERMFADDMSLRTKLMWRVNYVFLLLMNFPSVAFPLGFAGLGALLRDRRHRTAAVFFCVAIAVQALWSSNYLIWDMYAFGLPVWVMFGLLVMVGLDWAWRKGGRVRTALMALMPTLLLPPLLYAQVVRWAQEDGFWKSYFSGHAASLYDSAEFFANPNKRSYTRTEDIVAGYARTLPEGAHLWDSDGKGYYPFRMYYQRVLGHRMDVQSHLIFGGFLDPEKARKHAAEMKAVLEQGAPVFIGSVTPPDRLVLVELFRLLDPGAPPLKELRRMPIDQFLERFPRYRIEPVPLQGVEDAVIYQIVPR